MKERRPISAEVYAGDTFVGVADDIEFVPHMSTQRREPSPATGIAEMWHVGGQPVVMEASGMIDTSALWDFDAMKKRQAELPPWSPEHRERVRRELRGKPLFFAKVPTVTRTPDQATLFDAINETLRAQNLALMVPSSAEMTILSPRPPPTVLREERRARAANVGHYCRKCRGFGTKRHHAMCPKRGVWRQTYKWVAPGYESGQDRRKQASQR